MQAAQQARAAERAAGALMPPPRKPVLLHMHHAQQLIYGSQLIDVWRSRGAGCRSCSASCAPSATTSGATCAA